MARTPDPEKKRGKTGASVVVWVLMGMLVLGLGGFGVTNFGGGQRYIGKVGDREIGMDDYSRALQSQLSAMSAQTKTQITLQQAQAFGLDAQVRQQLVNTAAMENEAQRIGLSVGDARVAREITDMPTFKGTAGTFDRDAYRFALERNRMTEASFERRVRDDLTRSLLQGAVSGGFAAPAALTDTLYAYISERRAFSLLSLTEADLDAPVPQPTDAELQTYYKDHIADFTKPEAKRITYAAVLPEDIADAQTVDQAALRQAYQDRIAEFVQPERRLVERLAYPTQADADAAKTRLDAGESFEALATERGVKLSDIDLGDVPQDALGAAGPAVFALKEPGVVGPFASDFGPALFRMNGILAAQTTSFAEAEPDLKPELATDAARRAIAAEREKLDDRLAGGDTLEQLADETDMTLGTVDYAEGTDDKMAGYPAFREAAETVKDGDFPQIVQLDDGGVFALRLDAVVPAAPIPFDAAKADVTTAWTAAAVTRALSDRAAAIAAKAEAGAPLETLGKIAAVPAMPRSGTVPDAPPGLLVQVFAMEPGQVRVVEDGDFVAVVRLDTVVPGAKDGADATALRASINVQAQQALSQDAMQLYISALTNGAGISMDDAAVAAVHAQFR